MLISLLISTSVHLRMVRSVIIAIRLLTMIVNHLVNVGICQEREISIALTAHIDLVVHVVILAAVVALALVIIAVVTLVVTTATHLQQ